MEILLYFLLPVTAETVIIHPDKGILFCQCNDGFLHFIEFIGRKQSFHDEKETIKMCIVNISAAVSHQQRLFPFVEGGLLLKKAVIEPASVCAQISDDRHAVHVASEDRSPLVHSQTKSMSNGILDGLLRNRVKNEMSDIVNKSTYAYKGISCCRSFTKCFR